MLSTFPFSEVPNCPRNTVSDHRVPGIGGMRAEICKSTLPSALPTSSHEDGVLLLAEIPLPTASLFDLESGAYKRRDGELFSVSLGLRHAYLLGSNVFC